jgi:hypothetical protein
VAKTVAETLVSVDIVVLNRLRVLKGEVRCIAILGLLVRRWRIICGRLWPVQPGCCCIAMAENRRTFP